jgi:quinoprotein glucose dehydrogenase
VPGELSSPTQPFPTRLPPFSRQSFTPDEVNPYVSDDEQAGLRQLVREAANSGVFTPSSHLRPHIQFPGAWGGANWGSTAGDPETGMLFIRTLEMISYRKMSLVEPARGGGGGGGGRGQGAAPLAPREQEGQNVYLQRCAGCHGPGQMPMRSLKVISSEGFRSIVRKGVSSMPPFPATTISNDALDTLESYLIALPTSDEQAGNPSEIRLPQNPNRYQGPPTRYSGSFSAGWYTSNIRRTAWSQLVAWRTGDQVARCRRVAPGLADKSSPGPSGRASPVVTAGGLVFLATRDRFLRAFDERPVSSSGSTARRESRGCRVSSERTAASVAAGASGHRQRSVRNPLHRKEGKVEAQGIMCLRCLRGSNEKRRATVGPEQSRQRFEGTS